MKSQKYVFLQALIIAFVIVLGLGIAMGYGSGFRDGVEFSVKFAANFITIEFDEQYISDGIFRYKNHIGGCLDAPNYTD